MTGFDLFRAVFIPFAARQETELAAGDEVNTATCSRRIERSFLRGGVLVVDRRSVALVVENFDDRALRGLVGDERFRLTVDRAAVGGIREDLHTRRRGASPF